MKLIIAFLILPLWSFAQLQPLPMLKSVEVYEFKTFADSDQSVGTTIADIAGSSFTIPSAGSWLVTYYVYGALSIANNTATTAQLDVLAGQSVSVKIDSLGAITSASIVQIGGTGSAPVTAVDWNEPYTTEFANQINALQGTDPNLYAQLASYVLPNP